MPMVGIPAMPVLLTLLTLQRSQPVAPMTLR
jgi:hypothetical protein